MYVAMATAVPMDYTLPLKQGTSFQIFCVIIIIIISIFKEDNVFSIIASLPYGPPMNTDIDYYRT